MRPCLLLRGRAGMPAMADPVDREAFVSASGMFPLAEGAGRRGRLRRDANRQPRVAEPNQAGSARPHKCPVLCRRDRAI